MHDQRPGGARAPVLRLADCVTEIVGDMMRHARTLRRARIHAKSGLPFLHLRHRKFGAKRLGDIVFNIDRFRLVILGNPIQALLLLRIMRRLGFTPGARGLLAKIISGSVNVPVHSERTSGCLNGSACTAADGRSRQLAASMQHAHPPVWSRLCGPIRCNSLLGRPQTSSFIGERTNSGQEKRASPVIEAFPKGCLPST
jgi:hypothetical protein